MNELRLMFTFYFREALKRMKRNGTITKNLSFAIEAGLEEDYFNNLIYDKTKEFHWRDWLLIESTMARLDRKAYRWFKSQVFPSHKDI